MTSETLSHESPPAVNCSKGWGERCSRSKGPRCECSCGERNHGNPKARRNGSTLFEHGSGPERATLPFDGDIICSWNGDYGCRFNISQKIVLHSPTGMEWGYGGSGPADFALNILFHFTRDKHYSEMHHQQFKWDFVAKLPREGGRIDGEQIREWIACHE